MKPWTELSGWPRTYFASHKVGKIVVRPAKALGVRSVCRGDAIHAQLKEGKVSVLARACGENAMRPCRVIAQSYSVPRECLLECGSFTCKIMEGRCGCPRNPHILGCKMTAYVAEVQTPSQCKRNSHFRLIDC